MDLSEHRSRIDVIDAQMLSLFKERMAISEEIAKEKLAAGKGSRQDVELIRKLSGYMQKTCFCPLGQSATSAFMSALKLFPEDFDAKIGKEA